MTLWDLIAPALPALRDKIESQIELLKKFAAKYPELAAQTNAAIAELEEELARLGAVATPEIIGGLSLTAIKELMNLRTTGLRPASHPGDVTGG